LMMPGAVTPALIEEIDRAGPFGQGAPAPRSAFAAMGLTHARRSASAVGPSQRRPVAEASTPRNAFMAPLQ
ncbi:MAG: hypothetical protein F9K34_18150, partial [Albidovulum sp.]